MPHFMKPVTTFCLYFLLVIWPLLAGAQGGDSPHRPRIGLVLSGGGALGLAHIGVLEVLEEMLVPVDCIAGTSMGAMVGGSFAAGVSAAEMREHIVHTDIASLFDDQPPRSQIPMTIKRDDYSAYFHFTLGYNDGDIQLPPGASTGYRFELFLQDVIGAYALMPDVDFNDLPTPFRAVATDLESGERIVFSKGDLTRSLRASMSLPAVVAPTMIDDRLYIDGGLVRNMPVDVARDHCADVIIAVDLGTSPASREDIQNSLDVALQSIILLTDRNIRQSRSELTLDDVYIVPDLSDYTSTSFSQQEDIIRRGADAAKAVAYALEGLSLSPDEYRSWQQARQSRRLAMFEPTSIGVLQGSGINEKAIMREISVTAENFDVPAFNDELVSLYGRGDYEYLGYRYDEDSGQIVIDAETKSWGPGYLKLGLGAVSDLESPTQLNIIGSYRRTWVNSLGAEWRSEIQIGYHSLVRTEFLQPLQIRDGLFLSPYLSVDRDFIEIFIAKQHQGDIETRTACAGLRFGITSVRNEISIAPYYCAVSTDTELGIVSSALRFDRLKQAGTRLEIIHDSLDSYTYPRSGILASLEIDSAHEDWGADRPFTRGVARYSGATSFTENTVALELEWGDEIGGNDGLPPYRIFQLGGPRRLAGLFVDQLIGPQYDLVALSYYRRVASLPSQFGRGLYVGAALESGSIDDLLAADPGARINSVSIFWGAETLLGVAYLGYGHADNGQSAVYLSIGPRF